MFRAGSVRLRGVRIGGVAHLLRAAPPLFLTLEAGRRERSARPCRVTDAFANARISQSTISALA